MTDDETPKDDSEQTVRAMFDEAMNAVAQDKEAAAAAMYSKLAHDCAKSVVLSHHPDRENEEVDLVVLEPEGLSVRVIVSPAPCIAIVGLFEPDEETIPTTFMVAPSILTRDNAEWLMRALESAIETLDEHLEGGEDG